MRIDPIDTNRNRLLSRRPINIVQGLDNVRPRPDLVRRCNRIFQIEKDVISGGLRRFLDHLQIGAGYGQLAAMQAKAGRLISSMTHGGRCDGRLGRCTVFGIAKDRC